MTRGAKLLAALLTSLAVAVTVTMWISPTQEHSCRSLGCFANGLSATGHWNKTLPFANYALVASSTGNAVLLVGGRIPNGSAYLYVDANLTNPQKYAFAVATPYCCAPPNAAISANGDFFAIAVNDLFVFHRGSSDPLIHFILPPSDGSADYFTSVAMSSDGSVIAAVSGAGRVFVFSTSSPEPTWNVTIVGGYWPGIAMTPDGRFLAVAGNASVWLFSSARPAPIHVWRAERALVYPQVVLASDGSLAFVTAFGKGNAFFERLPLALPGPDWTLDLGPNGWLFAAVDPQNSRILVTNLGTGRLFVLSATGVPVDSWDLGAPLSGPSLLGHGEGLVVGSGNRVVVLAPAESAVLGWVDIPGVVFAGAGALDHLFVLSLENGATNTFTLNCLAVTAAHGSG